MQNFKSTVTRGLKICFKCPNDADFPKSLQAIASFLDPRHKTLRLNIPIAVKEEVKNQILVLAQQENCEETQIKNEEVPIKKQKKAVFSCLDGDFADINDDVGLDAEIERYLVEPVQIRNPLIWWKHYESRFATLYKLARKVLCIMGTSVPSGRAFSQAG